jgi:2-methylcitrate dehydratase PrpD
MSTEQQLADFVCSATLADLPASGLQTARRLLLAATGTAVAGAGEDGVAALRGWLLDNGGAPQARCLVFGDRLPAAAAALLNGTMCRALDYCDAMAPGVHIGSSLIPAAFAAAELAAGCSGETLLVALAVGAELTARLNLDEAQYDGFDPTGVAAVFAATAAAARILALTRAQTLHALALAFNRCGGSFQSNIDGALAVRLIQGWVAETGVVCAQLAQRGLTGPAHFIGGIYGYAHLYGRGRLDPQAVVAGLGREWRLERMMFKKYPSCGLTQGLTEVTLNLVQAHGIAAAQVHEVQVRLPPYAFRLVGHAFRLGDNPRVNAQFSAQYCAANAIVRRASLLTHFRPAEIADPAVQALVPRVHTVADAALDARGHSAVDVAITTIDGRTHAAGIDIAPGFPGNALSEEQHLARFADCLRYAALPLAGGAPATYLAQLQALAALPDARVLVDSLIAPH